MKFLTLRKTETPAPQLYVAEGSPTEPVRHVTINHVSQHNHQHPRNIQISNEFIFVKRYGAATVGIHIDDLVQLLTSVEPSLSWPPKFLKNVMTQGETVTVESHFDENNPELTPEQGKTTYRWQKRDHPSVKWEDMKDDAVFSSTNTNKLVVKNSPGIKAVEIRCVATNAAGSRASSVIASRPPLPHAELPEDFPGKPEQSCH